MPKETVPVTPTMNFRKGHATNSTATSFASKIPTITEPSGDGVHKVAPGSWMPNAIMAVFFGAGSENDTFSARIIGWRKIATGGGDPNTLYIPMVLAELGCTISATVGIANSPLVATDRFVDTISLITGNDDVSIDIVSPTADEIGHVVLDIKGCNYLEFSYDMTGATNGNCVFAYL